ncbi:flagellar basal body L-ring protein FlgH [Leptospira meyeri]|uniref:flagellar basal body L-ring protein FlgH n=1 Tax=Leptospira meyeri TaxID=29508 RepID=UPI000C2B3F0A|nr:flagellar basal body L-ring protein FlgH [Leptospira meyeri]PKA22517.1 endoflagellar basal body L-ring protein [Leptospira sp. mixed culture ATI2-C-A1]PJZ82656.1 endoflagellar basal body L-ring protein [Leptospira meyeri]PJZ98105.1 endoflagellar basal body L-ring protein [Leptospira meyeri]PKA11661.1 endoflagellar basal body L-ring protein [Leptospira meyeri]TGL14245.1 endoflagellar basal body L-ring protein [Leptospira meyeri]
MIKNQNFIQNNHFSLIRKECLHLDLNSIGASEDIGKNIPSISLSFLFVFAASIFFSAFSLSAADSLWKDKDPYSYPKTIQPGTVVKVVLKNGLRVEYESEYKATFDNDIKTVPDKKLVPDLPAYNSNSTYMRSKVGKSKSQGKVVGVMAVLVTGIDPGTGNLELEGSKVFNLSEERINLRLSGTISPEDLDKNRFISSDLIANLRVEYQGTLNPKELTSPNVQMKRITNPDGTVTEKAELSEQEKQEIILKNIKRLLGESE